MEDQLVRSFPVWRENGAVITLNQWQSYRFDNGGQWPETAGWVPNQHKRIATQDNQAVFAISETEFQIEATGERLTLCEQPRQDPDEPLLVSL